MVLVTVHPKHSGSAIQARDCLRKATKKNFDSILQRFQQSETYRKPRRRKVWDEELCERLDRVAREDHSYIATRDEDTRIVGHQA